MIARRLHQGAAVSGVVAELDRVGAEDPVDAGGTRERARSLVRGGHGGVADKSTRTGPPVVEVAREEDRDAGRALQPAYEGHLARDGGGTPPGLVRIPARVRRVVHVDE